MYTYSLEPLKKIGLHTHKATKLALKIYANSFQYAYKPVSTRRALKKVSLNSHHQIQAWAAARNPRDPHGLLSFASTGEGVTQCLGPRFPLLLD
eukprot:816833-Pelagomonas_calceolata.AAC.1